MDIAKARNKGNKAFREEVKDEDDIKELLQMLITEAQSAGMCWQNDSSHVTAEKHEQKIEIIRRKILELIKDMDEDAWKREKWRE